MRRWGIIGLLCPDPDGTQRSGTMHTCNRSRCSYIKRTKRWLKNVERCRNKRRWNIYFLSELSFLHTYRTRISRYQLRNERLPLGTATTRAAIMQHTKAGKPLVFTAILLSVKAILQLQWDLSLGVSISRSTMEAEILTGAKKAISVSNRPITMSNWRSWSNPNRTETSAAYYCPESSALRPHSRQYAGSRPVTAMRSLGHTF